MIIGLLLDDTLDSSDGVQQSVISIGSELSRRGHEVHYIVPATKRNDISNIHSIGKVISLKFNGNTVRTPLPVSKYRIRQLFSEIKFDVLHVQMPYSPVLSARVLKYAPRSVRKVGTFHILPYGFLSSFGTRLLGIFMRRSINSLDSLVAVSEPAKEFMNNAFRVRGGVLPNPVVYDFYHSFTRQKNTKTNIVFVGRFEERKGVEELVEAYSKLPVDILKITQLTMCGRGPLVDTVKDKAIKLKLDVNFPGFVTDEQKAQYLADADIAVFPSKSGESFGIVLTEAMSARSGIVLGGNNPGYASVLSDWPETLFNPTDIDEFSSTLHTFITDRKLRTSIGLKQHEAAKKYDIKTIVNKLENIYTSESN